VACKGHRELACRVTKVMSDLKETTVSGLKAPKGILESAYKAVRGLLGKTEVRASKGCR